MQIHPLSIRRLGAKSPSQLENIFGLLNRVLCHGHTHLLETTVAAWLFAKDTMAYFKTVTELILTPKITYLEEILRKGIIVVFSSFGKYTDFQTLIFPKWNWQETKQFRIKDCPLQL